MEIEKRLLNDGFEQADIRKISNLVSSSWNVADLSRFMYGAKVVNTINKKIVNVLDVGCSSGRFLQVQQSFARTPSTKSIQYVGIDMRESSLKKCKKFAEDNLSEKAKERIFVENVNILEVEDAKGLLSKYGKFDVIAAFEVFEHFPEELSRRFLKNTQNLLNENGVLILSTPVHFKDEPMYWPDDHAKEYMYEELKVLVEEFFGITKHCGNHVMANLLKKKLQENEEQYSFYKKILKASSNGVWLNEIVGSAFYDCCKGHIFVCERK